MKLKILLLVISTMALVADAAPTTVPLLLSGNRDGNPRDVTRVHPLDTLVLENGGGVAEVHDGAGKIYFSASFVNERISFVAGGALGTQTVLIHDLSGKETARLNFLLEAETSIDDGGKYRDMFALFRAGLSADFAGGVEQTVWNGKTYHFFVNWVLDNYHTAKGMKYFSPHVTEFIDMMRSAQREDGMIWSNINPGAASDYYQTAYGPFGYIRKYGDRFFVRQPTENHPEYIYVSTIYQSWKAGVSDEWMKECLPSAKRALDYAITDAARWSERFQLLKRVYTIDSWDFQVDDAYTPDIGLTNTMLIDPQKSKFGVFFGDNTHYAAACDELAEMLDHAGQPADAARYRERATGIRQRLDALSWNGKFFTHFIDEDPTVKRDLGVDEKSQIAQGNAYSLNRGISPSHSVAIIQTYIDLKQNLPPGSPGEWYAIYPPFPKGFTQHNKLWQYMNGGVGGHVAGELARGAFENGFEPYARDILDRLTDLGHKHGNKIWFAYTGSIPPPPPPPKYKPVDLAPFANMDIEQRGGPGAFPWMQMPKPGDDIRGLPVGPQKFAGIDFNVIDPEKNQRRAALAVSHRSGFPASADVPVHNKAGAIYLLHTSTKPTSEKVSGSLAFLYADGTRAVQYLIMEKQLTYWWFPDLKTDTSGVAWHGPSPISKDVGLSWCAIDNPHPEKSIDAIRFQAPEDNGIYTVVGLTLSDREHSIAPNPVSFGGPDDWAAATAMAAMIEGLAGVNDSALSQAFTHPIIAPRWDLSEDRSIQATVRYAVSEGYVAYRFDHHTAAKEILATVTGSGSAINCHFLLPPNVTAVKSVEVDGAVISSTISETGGSHYTDFSLENNHPRNIRIRW